MMQIKEIKKKLKIKMKNVVKLKRIKNFGKKYNYIIYQFIKFFNIIIIKYIK